MANPSLILLNVDPSTWANPPEGKTFIGTNELGQLVTKVHDGSPTVIGAGGQPSFHKQSSASSPIGITPTNAVHTEVVTLTGIARDIAVLISNDGHSDGDLLTVLFVLPAVSGLHIEVFSDVNELTDYTSDGGTLRASFKYYFDAGQWKQLEEAIPAFTPLA